MHGFRVIYRQGSFALADSYASREQALARAASLLGGHGVWHVHVEDREGRRLFTCLEVEEWRRGAAMCWAG